MSIPKRLAPVLLAASATLSLSSCGSVSLSKSHFGTLRDGRPAALYTLKNSTGMVAEITDYGGIVTRLLVPDKTGQTADVVLGYDQLSNYIKASPYFGCIVGRYANRIAGGRFEIDSIPYTLATNNGRNHLHGGDAGFDKKLWTAREVRGFGKAGVELTYTSADGEEGYPGALTSKVTYWLTTGNELRIEYEATTDKTTPVNLTHHSYFNLAGAGSGDILDHQIQIFANKFVPIDNTSIPLGQLREVAGTPFDFRSPHAIGERIGARDAQLAAGHGYDHSWALDRRGAGMSLAARVHDPASGRVMEVLTDQPGIQFYTANFLNGSNVGKGDTIYRHRAAFCLETGTFPDSPNQPRFPSSLLHPGQTYQHRCTYRFSNR